MTVEYAHVVSFRLTDEQAVQAEMLRAAFENQTWAEMGRWLFSDPRICSIMAERIHAEMVEVEWGWDDLSECDTPDLVP